MQIHLREAFALKPPLAAAFDNFVNGQIYHGKPGKFICALLRSYSI